MSADPLFDWLHALASRLDRDAVRITIAGGYGLLLRETVARRRGSRPRRGIPAATRSTDDLDVLLAVEIITDPAKMRSIREALDDLGFMPHPRAQNYQFVERARYERGERGVKIDLLAPSVPPELEHLVTTDSGRDVRRIRPKGFNGLHAHVTPEALTAADHLLEVTLGSEGSPVVYVPHPYSHLMLKLYALRDRMWEAGEANFGRHHAFDIYRILALTTDEDWTAAASLREKFGTATVVRRANAYAAALFANDGAPGATRLAEYARDEGVRLTADDVRATVEDLAALFPGGEVPPPVERHVGPAWAGVEAAENVDEARALLLSSLETWADLTRQNVPAEVVPVVDTLRAAVEGVLRDSRDISSRLIRCETWESGILWASRRNRENRDRIQGELKRLEDALSDRESSDDHA